MVVYSTESFEPDCSLGYLARRVHQIGGTLLEPVFAEEGLTGIQWSALVSIWFKRGSTCAEIARDLSHDKGAMTRLVDTLEESGFVTRTRHPDDRRVINLALTPQGEAVAARCRDRVIACWNGWLSGWDSDDVATLIALMQKLRDTLKAAAREGQSSCA